jgi:hypothetical protein
MYVAMHNKSRIAAVAAFAHRPKDGLIVLGEGPMANVHRHSRLRIGAF